MNYIAVGGPPSNAGQIILRIVTATSLPVNAIGTYYILYCKRMRGEQTLHERSR